MEKEELRRKERRQQGVKEENVSHIVATLHAGFHYINQNSQCLHPSCDNYSGSPIPDENQTLKNISFCQVGSDPME
jgi:hypothetical protein